MSAGQAPAPEAAPAAPKEYVEQGKGEWNKDSTNKVAPTEMSIPIGTKAAAGDNDANRRSSRKQSAGKAVKAKGNAGQTKASANVNARTDNMPVIN